MEIIMISKLRRKIELSVIYILNLSVSDLFIGFIIVITKIIYEIHSQKTTFIYNIVVHSVVRVSIIMSSLSLIVVTLDRYFAVLSPFRYRRVKRYHAVIICVVLWLFTSVCVTIMKVMGVSKHQNIERYQDLLLPIIVFPTSGFLVFGYYSIVHKMRKIGHELRRKSALPIPSDRLKLAKERKRQSVTTKLIVSIISVYILCWYPLSIMAIYQTVGTKTFAFDVCFCFTLMNSCFNPIIYFNHFRKKVKRVISHVRNELGKLTTTNDQMLSNDHRGDSTEKRKSSYSGRVLSIEKTGSYNFNAQRILRIDRGLSKKQLFLEDKKCRPVSLENSITIEHC